jgi:hypothetical protein
VKFYSLTAILERGKREGERNAEALKGRGFGGHCCTGERGESGAWVSSVRGGSWLEVEADADRRGPFVSREGKKNKKKKRKGEEGRCGLVGWAGSRPLAPGWPSWAVTPFF